MTATGLPHSSGRSPSSAEVTPENRDALPDLVLEKINSLLKT